MHHDDFTEVGYFGKLLSHGWPLALTHEFGIAPDDNISCMAIVLTCLWQIMASMPGRAFSSDRWSAEVGVMVGGFVDSVSLGQSEVIDSSCVRECTGA